MRSLLVFFLSIGVLLSCNSSKSFVGNIDSIEIEVTRNEIVNVGSNFEYTLYALLKSGDRRKIKDDDIVSIQDGMFSDAGKHRALVAKPLPNFKDSIFPITIEIAIGEYQFTGNDSVQLNFKGPIKVDWSQKNGADGTQPRASAATLFGRDGMEGRSGGDGENGASGRNVTSYLWIEDDELRMMLTCDRCDENYYFRSISKNSVWVNLTGGDGGNGGQGGTGGNGKPGKLGKPPGNGADGGIGGNGGDGGDGGSMVLFIHPTAAHLDESITLLNSAGIPGNSGEGGDAGAGGEPFKNQKEGTAGNPGICGKKGKSGKNGPALTISKVAFDPEAINDQE